MPKKAETPSAKSKSQERREAVQKKAKGDILALKLKDTGKLTAEELRQASRNGLVEDREIVELDFGEGSALVGYGTMVRGELFTRQKEKSVPTHTEQHKQFLKDCRESLEAFIPTIKDPTEDSIDNIN